MARLPDRYNLSGPESLRSGRQISSADTTAIGRGMQSLGSSIQQAGGVAASIAAKEKQKATALGIARANAYQDQQNIELANSFANDPDYATFGARADERARQIAAQAAEFIPDPEARELWKVQADTTAKAATDNVLDAGVKLKRQDDLVKLDEALEVQRRIYVDPTTTEAQKDAARAKIEGTIEVAKGAGLLLPDEYSNRKQVFLEGADVTRAKLDTTLTDPRAGYFAAIRAAESGGNDSAKNPNSTATGRYQFTEGTWDRLVAAYPNAGLTVGGRTDPAQQERAIRLFTAENERALAQAGIPATNGNLYAAHFLGAGGATKVLGAPDGAALEGLLPTEVITANPFLKGMTVADFKGWADGKGGGSGVVPAYVERLSPEDRQTVFDMREAEARQAATAQAAQAKIEYANLDGQIGLGILTGDVVSEQQILDSALDDADKAKHLRSFRSEQSASAEARAYGAALADGTASRLNPYSSDDRALAEKTYELLSKSVAEEDQASLAAAFVQASGVVPKSVVADVRQSLGSMDEATVVGGLQKAAMIDSLAPLGLKGAESGNTISDAARNYRFMVNDLGLTPEQAAQRYLAMNDPEQIERRQALLKTKRIKDHVEAIDADDVGGAFSTPGFVPFTSNVPKVGETPLAEAAAVGDYKRLFEESLVDMNGDIDAARALANQRINLRYGASPLTLAGEGVVTFLPPEKVYPPGQDGTHNYIIGQARDALAEQGVTAQKVWLQAYDETERAWEAGAPALYQLHYEDADGLMQMYHLPFFADPANSAPYAFEENRAARDANKQFMQDSEALDDPLRAPAFGPGVMDMGQP